MSCSGIGSEMHRSRSTPTPNKLQLGNSNRLHTSDDTIPPVAAKDQRTHGPDLLDFGFKPGTDRVDLLQL
jgi:hypothetical protein